MKKILVIDNYDSFVYNVVQLLRESGSDIEIEVWRNDRIDTASLNDYTGIILSPGPGIPSEAGRLMNAVSEIIRLQIPVLGICLGHQALAEAFGGRLLNIKNPLHGHSSVITVVGYEDPLFAGISQPIVVGRYHSWIVERNSLPSDLVVSSFDECDDIMSFYHLHLPVFGVQFHPESYISNCGKMLIKNWLEIVLR